MLDEGCATLFRIRGFKMFVKIIFCCGCLLFSVSTISSSHSCVFFNVNSVLDKWVVAKQANERLHQFAVPLQRKIKSINKLSRQEKINELEKFKELVIKERNKELRFLHGKLKKHVANYVSINNYTLVLLSKFKKLNKDTIYKRQKNTGIVELCTTDITDSLANYMNEQDYSGR